LHEKPITCNTGIVYQEIERSELILGAHHQLCGLDWIGYVGPQHQAVSAAGPYRLEYLFRTLRRNAVVDDD
jgi:hypothetical protein